MKVSGEVRESLELVAPITEVWRAWTDPAWLAGWMVERATGAAGPGGRLEMAWDSLGIAVELEVVAAEAPRRLVLRGGPPGRPPQTQHVELSAVAPGRTLVEVRHEGFAAGARGDDER